MPQGEQQLVRTAEHTTSATHDMGDADEVPSTETVAATIAGADNAGLHLPQGNLVGLGNSICCVMDPVSNERCRSKGLRWCHLCTAEPFRSLADVLRRPRAQRVKGGAPRCTITYVGLRPRNLFRVCSERCWRLHVKKHETNTAAREHAHIYTQKTAKDELNVAVPLNGLCRKCKKKTKMFCMGCVYNDAIAAQLRARVGAVERLNPEAGTL
jgi:hypothetical protein